MDKYPFISCLRPVRVRNKSTQELKYVKCGHCVACVNHKSMRGVSMCELEQKGTFSNTYFITLTYDEDTIPKYEIVNTDDDCMYMLRDLNPRSDTYNQLLDSPFFISDKQKEYILNKCRVGKNCFSYLYYKDIQDFLKRVRKDIKKKYNEEIRFYITGEYGPKRLRAHWHIIIFARKKIGLLNGNRYIRSKWKQGFTYSERARNGAVSYCSSYVNSGFSLPGIYKDAKISTKSYHSVRMGFETVKDEFRRKIDEVISQKTERKEKIQISLPIDGYLKEFTIDTTYQNACYPKPYGFNALKSDPRGVRYVHAYEYYFRKFSRCGDIVNLSIRSLSEITLNYLLNVRKKKNDTFSYDFSRLLDIEYVNLDEYDDIRKCPLFSRIYSFMRFSYGIYIGKYDFDKIVKYYDILSYRSLVNQYMLQEEYFRYFGYREHELPLFYHNLWCGCSLSLLEQNSFYKWYGNKHKQIHDRKLLRKKVNDAVGMVG